MFSCLRSTILTLKIVLLCAFFFSANPFVFSQHVCLKQHSHEAMKCGTIPFNQMWETAKQYGIAVSIIEKKKLEAKISRMNALLVAQQKNSSGEEKIAGARIHYYHDAIEESGASNEEEFRSWVKYATLDKFQENVEASNIDFDGMVLTDMINHGDNFYGDCEFNTINFNAIFGIGEPYTSVASSKDDYDTTVDIWITPNCLTLDGVLVAGAATVISNGNENKFVNIFMTVSTIHSDSMGVVGSHEFGHAMGGQHRIQDGTLGGNPDAYCAETPDSVSTMFPSSVLIRANRFSDGNTFGNPQQNVRKSVEEDLTQYWVNFYPSLTTLGITQDIQVCEGNVFTLDGCSNNGDQVEISVLSGDITLDDPTNLTTSGTAITDGEILVRVQNSNKPYFREKVVSITVLPASSSKETYAGCSGDGYSLTVNGNIYDETNPTGTEILTGLNSCDSIISIELNFAPLFSSEENYLGCMDDGYEISINGTLYSEANSMGTEVFLDANGCDSIVTIDLQFLNPNFSASGSELTANTQTADNYQWLLDGVPIQDATDSEWTATETGNYSLQIISNGVSCLSSETPIVITNIEDHLLDIPIGIYPNPASSKIIFDFVEDLTNSLQYEVYNTNGALVLSSPVAIGSKEELSIGDLEGGLYLVRFTNGDKHKIRQFIKF